MRYRPRMRYLSAVIIAAACGSSTPPATPAAEAPSPPETAVGLAFAPPDTRTLAHLDVRFLLSITEGSKLDRSLDEIGAAVPTCHRRLLAGIETITAAIRLGAGEDPTRFVARVTGEVDSDALEACLRDLPKFGAQLTVARESESLVVSTTAGRELVLVVWRDDGLIVGPRDDLAHTSGPANEIIRNAVAHLESQESVAWFAGVYDDHDKTHHAALFEVIEDDGIRIRLGYRYDTVEEAAARTEMIADEFAEVIPRINAERGLDIDPVAARDRMVTTVVDQWAITSFHWSWAEIADFVSGWSGG